MVSVCVVGGGTAGSEAASEASLRGAEVTVVERLERPSPGWKTWPNLIRVLSQDSEAEFSTWPAGAPQDRKVVAEVLSARSGSVKTSAGTLRPDFVVLATGSSFEPPTFQGHR